MKRLLHIGAFNKGSTSLRRRDAFKTMDYIVDEIDLDKYVKFWRSGWISVERLLPVSPFQIRFNQDIRKLLKTVSYYDAIIMEKPKYIFPSNIKLLKKKTGCLVHYSPDDYENTTNKGWYDKSVLSACHIIITTKLHNLKSLRKKFPGSVVLRQVSGGPKACPPHARIKYHYDISFVGQFEQDRAAKIRMLAKSIDKKIHIFGPDWNQVKMPPNVIKHPAIWGEEFVKVLQTTRINLCFLRKANKDTATTRTFEIVSSGSLLIAERTEEHLSLFREFDEAFYFDGDEELKLLTKRLLVESAENNFFKIRQSAFRRYCERGYSDNEIWSKFFDNCLPGHNI